MKSNYSQELIDNASKYGFKTANLMFMQNQIEKFNSNSSQNIKAKIPSFTPVASDLIVEHLDRYAFE